MQYKIHLLTQTINELERLPVDELQKENEVLKSENADLEEQVKFINENYERHQEEKSKIENYLADLEETIEEKGQVDHNTGIQINILTSNILINILILPISISILVFVKEQY